jgi:glycosyltransferase involved in cell wall biosynthesis/SAM-dependent methyltransferase
MNEVIAGHQSAVAHRQADLVSVIIPCYNQADYLAEAIESVFAQTFPHVEIVVVDDGSQDGTAAVAARYPGVHYIRQHNQGPSAARNAGLRASSGEYLVFLDADDRLLPDALAVGRACLDGDPAYGFVSGRYRNISADRAVVSEPPPQKLDADRYRALLLGNYIGMHAAVMYRRAALEAVGGFDASLRGCEDYDLYLRMARRFPIGCHGQLVAEYRNHPANSSANAELMFSSALTVLGAQQAYVKRDPRYAQAWKTGIRAWTEYYGPGLVQQVRERLRARAWWPALRGMLRLVRHYPAGIVALFTRPSPAERIRHRLPAWARGQGDTRVGHVRFGDLRRVVPISAEFGYDRGQPIDRYYIDRFLARSAGAIRGRVLEIGDDTYTRQFGGDRVTISDVLHISEGNPLATIVADLTQADQIASNSFDCILLIQTLQLIYDLPAAIRTIERILKPGGVLLATFPGISQLSADEWAETWYWSFTTLSARRLFEAVFPAECVEILAYGNVLAATAFLQGLAAEELRREELDQHDPQYQLLLCLRAQKAEAPL